MQFGYPPAIIRTDKKEWYLTSLESADAGNLEPFFEYVIREVIHSLDIMIRWAQWENIDDEDDVDKEIRLLKGEMQTNKKQIFWSKKEKVQYLLVRQIIPFIRDIYDALYWFQDFYNYPIHSFCIFNHTAKNGFNLFEKIIDSSKLNAQEHLTWADIFLPEKIQTKFTDNLHSIIFWIKFIGLNTVSDNKNQEYTLNIKIVVFRENYFELIVDRFDGVSSSEFFHINQTYIEKISQWEIETVIKLIKKDHLEFIKSHKNPSFHD